MEPMPPGAQRDVRGGVPTLEGLGAYVTVKEASRLLGLSIGGVHSAIRRRRVPTLRLGNALLLRVSDLKLVR